MSPHRNDHCRSVWRTGPGKESKKKAAAAPARRQNDRTKIKEKDRNDYTAPIGKQGCASETRIFALRVRGRFATVRSVVADVRRAVAGLRSRPRPERGWALRATSNFRTDSLRRCDRFDSLAAAASASRVAK